MKKIILLLLVVMLSACRPQVDDGYRNVTINSIGFRIPVEYYHPLAIPRNNTEDVSALLNVLMPDIRPYEVSQTELYKQEMQHVDASLMISSPFTDVKQTNEALPFKDRVLRFSEVNKTSHQIDDIYGLHYLTRPADIKMDWDEILFEGTKTDPKTILFCRPSVEVRPPYPQCRMQFEYMNNVIGIRFRRKEWSAQWKSIKENTIKQLDIFHQNYLNHQEEKENG